MGDFVLVIQWIGSLFLSWFEISEGNLVLSIAEWVFSFGIFFSILALFFKGSGRG